MLEKVTLAFGIGPALWHHYHSFDLSNFYADDDTIYSIRSFYEGKLNQYNIKQIDSDPIHIFSEITYKSHKTYSCGKPYRKSNDSNTWKR